LEELKLENTHNFLLPGTNLIGTGCIKDLPTQLIPYKLSKALIVTDKNIIKFGYVEMVETILKSLFISYDVFDGVLHPNPTISFVENGAASLDKGQNLLKRDYHFIISIGGGTNHDTAKGIAIVTTNGGAIADYEGFYKMTKPSLPIITINTTGGSGAEVTDITIIEDESRKVKMTIMDPKMLPIMSVNDPMFMTTMPQEVTASSGMDTLTHAIEAFVSTEASPITDVLAIDAIRLVFGNLKRAYDNGNDLEARENMMYASVMAGMALNNAGLGYVHSIVHQFEGFYDELHGVSNAILLPHVFEFNAISVPEERIFKICEAMGNIAQDEQEAVNKIKQSIQKLTVDVGIPTNFNYMKIENKDLEMLSKNALKDITALTNPRKGTYEDIMAIFQTAMKA
jgi:alcohol dehydrogenase